MTAALILVQEAAQEAAEHGEGPASPFEAEFGLIFWTWVVFGILLALLYKYAWPHIVRLTEEREKTIQRQLEEAEKANAEARATLGEHQRLMAEAKEKTHALIADAKQIAQKEREQLLQKAREEYEQVLERAKRDIDAERERAIADLRREAVDLSLAAASRLINERLDTEANRKIVEDYLKSLEK